jgi:hypothetical protein
MFEITKYNFNSLETGQFEIRIDFKYTGSEVKNINVKVSNRIFTDIWHLVGGDIKVIPNHHYWVATTVNKPFDVKWNMDTYIEFVDIFTKELIEEHYCPNFFVDTKKRSLGDDYSKKNVWVFGDSHVDFFFTRNIKDKIFRTPNYILNPMSHAALTVNRFTNRDYLKFLSSYPIMDGDTIIFMLGEVDCRVALKRNAQLKGISLEEHINSVIIKYKSVLHQIQSQYPKCKIKVTNSLPMVRDNWITTDTKRLLGDSNEVDRMNTKVLFDKALKIHLENSFQIIDITHNLTDSKGYSNPKLLLEDDMHFKFTDTVINNIKNQLNG